MSEQDDRAAEIYADNGPFVVGAQGEEGTETGSARPEGPHRVHAMSTHRSKRERMDPDIDKDRDPTTEELARDRGRATTEDPSLDRDRDRDRDRITTDPALRGDLSGEDLSRGPTPETRHPAGHVKGTDFAENDSIRGETGGVDDVRDTTQGPTPETRQVMRATDDDDAAAGQPDADRRTRADVGGNQDVEPTRSLDPDRRTDR